MKSVLEPGPQGARGGESRIRINQTKQRTIGFCLVTRKDKLIFDGDPAVWLTFSLGNIGMTLTSQSANERHRLCHPYPHSKNIGCGGGKFTIMALKRRTRIIYDRYIYLLGNLFVWRTWCARVIVMRLRRD